ncbi:MAG: transglycosylase domain protein [Hyphomicrobiales bacterium]|nr:transglycosylase domain protein [Hyphomicrobiales bacterium]
MPVQSQTADLAFESPVAQTRLRGRGPAPVQPRAAVKKKSNGPSFAGFAVRSLLVSGLMATGSMAAFSALGRVPHEPNGILRASLAPALPAMPINAADARAVADAVQAPLSDKELARQAAEARKELAAASVIAEAVEGARKPGAAGSGFMRLFSSIITAKPDELGLSSDILKFGPMRIRQDLVSTIVRAAKETQSDPVLLMAIADKESSFATGVNASTSSAVGLFQFVEGTWFKVLRDFGADHGLAREAAAIESDLSAKERARILDMRKNPYLAAVMAAEMLKKDAADIGEKLGRSLTAEEIYLAHFLGPGDAFKFLAKVDSQPKAVAAKLLPKPARANRPIFFARTGRKSKSLSVAEVHRKLEQSMGLRLDRYRNVTDSVPTATAYR